MEFRKYASSPAKNELSSEEFLNRILISNGQFDPDAKNATWFNRPINTPTSYLADILTSHPANILGDTSVEKWIEIDLSTQQLYAHEGNRTIYTFPISSGLPWFPTVTGEFHIWAKLRSQEMIGGSKNDGTYYDLPNVPFIQYFYNGYGLHGAYWHNDFGKPRSHGCVNMRIADAQTLFYWTNPVVPDNKYAYLNIPPSEGTRVVVHGTTPNLL